LAILERYRHCGGMVREGELDSFIGGKMISCTETLMIYLYCDYYGYCSTYSTAMTVYSLAPIDLAGAN
jgi:hypothetical protein